MKRKRFILTGQTSSAKNYIAARAVAELPFEVISLDSMKVYELMDIGTAKPTSEDLKCVRHHLINIRKPSDYFDAGDYFEESEKAAQDIESRGKFVIYVGGTPMYMKIVQHKMFQGPSANLEIRAELREQIKTQGLESLFAELTRIDPMHAGKIHANDEMRIIRALEVCRLTGKTMSEQQGQFEKPREDVEFVSFGIFWEREKLYERINKRNEEMFAQGWVEETENILKTVGFGQQAKKGLGYNEILTYLLTGLKTLDETKELTAMNTRRFAKRQMTWFRKFNIDWITMDENKSYADAISEVREKIKKEIW